MPRKPIVTAHAPAAIGPYSQAVRAGNCVYLSGQIPLDPATGQLVSGDISAQARRVFDNLQAVCIAAGGSLEEVVRVTAADDVGASLCPGCLRSVEPDYLWCPGCGVELQRQCGACYRPVRPDWQHCPHCREPLV